jgi:hypothetical protein
MATSGASITTSTSSSLYSVDKLTADNFSSWKLRIKLVLMDRGLWEHVEGSQATPPTTDNDDVKAAWRTKNHQTLAQIVLTLSNSELPHVRKATTAQEAWKQICSVHEQKGLAAKVFLRRRFFSAKFKEGDTMQHHIINIRDMADKLEAMDAPVSDDDIAMTLLCSLPEQWDYLIASMETRSGRLSSDYSHGQKSLYFDFTVFQ